MFIKLVYSKRFKYRLNYKKQFIKYIENVRVNFI